MRKRYVVIVGLAVVVIALVVVGVRYNRGGTGSLDTFELRWVEACAPVDEDTLAATFLLRGYATRSISVGAELSVDDEVTGAQLGSSTERLVVTDRFRKQLRVEVDVDPDDNDDPDRWCGMSLTGAGWHLPGR